MTKYSHSDCPHKAIDIDQYLEFSEGSWLIANVSCPTCGHYKIDWCSDCDHAVNVWYLAYEEAKRRNNVE